MTEPVVADRAAALLRRDDAPVPLARLYRDVVRELGPVLSGPAQLHACLRERPDRFLVLDPPGEIAYSSAWPEDARRAYAAALEGTAFSPEPRVALAPAADTEPSASAPPAPAAAGEEANPGDDRRSGEAEAVLRRIDASIRGLAGAAAADPTVPAALAEADALRRALAAALADHGRSPRTGSSNGASR